MDMPIVLLKKGRRKIKMELLLNGYITEDYDGHPALRKIKDGYGYSEAISIPNAIQDKFNYQKLNRGLGEKLTMIPNCNLTIHYTKDICSYEEAQEVLLNALYGDMMVHTSYVGYSEYTITGLDLETFTIGGHDLAAELESHEGEYCWIKITD